MMSCWRCCRGCVVWCGGVVVWWHCALLRSLVCCRMQSAMLLTACTPRRVRVRSFVVCLSVCLSECLSVQHVSLSVQHVSLSVQMSLCLSVSWSVSLSLRLPVCLSKCLSICLSVCPFVPSFITASATSQGKNIQWWSLQDQVLSQRDAVVRKRPCRSKHTPLFTRHLANPSTNSKLRSVRSAFFVASEFQCALSCAFPNI